MFGLRKNFSCCRRVQHGLWIGISCLVLSCGSGGGGSSASNSNNTSSGSNSGNTETPIANAGADLTVNMSARVDLDPKVLVANGASYTLSEDGLDMTGSSTNPAAIVSLTWKKIEGPAIKLQSSHFNDGKVYFTAPSTEGLSSVKLVFRLTLQNAAGQSASDTITITVNRINLAPFADAGTLVTTKSGAIVTLDGNASKDVDGTIQKYSWVQKAGPAVTLSDASIAKPSFTTPDVSSTTSLEFELTVEDNEAAKSAASVSVTVSPNGTPALALHFPPPVGIYEGTTLSAFGTAAATAVGATLTGVSVDLGAGPIAATLKGDGSWRADNLIVPAGQAEFSVSVQATDSLGRKSSVVATLKTSTNATIGSGTGWSNVVGIEVDSAANKLFVLSGSDSFTFARLQSVDLNTGSRSADISNFSNIQQGITSGALVKTAYDPTTKKMYVTSAPASGEPSIFSIDTATGQRSLVADSTRGTGPELKLPFGIVAGGNSKLYVADNLSNTILAIDPLTGDRKVIADSSTGLYKIDAPSLLALDPVSSPNSLFLLPNVASDIYGLKLNLASSVVYDTLFFSDADFYGLKVAGMPDDIAIDAAIHKFFMRDKFGGILMLDTETGERSMLKVNVLSVDRIGYDYVRHLLYVLDDFPDKLVVVDPLTGQSAIVSKTTTF